MKNLAGLMKQAQQMQSKMEEMQAKLESTELTGESGAGLDDVFDQLRRRVPFTLVDDPALRPERIAVLRVRGLGDE